MRRKAPHAMTQGAPSHPPAGSPGPTMPPCRQRASSKAFPDLRKLRGRTSRLEPPASDPRQTRSACNEKQHHQPCRSSHGRKREGQTTGAIDTKVLESQSRGCSQALLYNAVRPHSSLGYTNSSWLRHARRAAGPWLIVRWVSQPGRLLRLDSNPQVSTADGAGQLHAVIPLGAAGRRGAVLRAARAVRRTAC